MVRTILSIDEKEGSLTFAGDVPEGAYVRLMKANLEGLVDGAAGEMDREKRQAMYYEAEQIVCCDEAIVAPLAYLTTRWITKPYLERSHREMWWDIYKWKVTPH